MSPEAAAKRGRRPRSPRLRAGEVIYLVAAILLFVFMFFTWFGAEISGSAGTIKFGGTGSGGDAWQTLEVIPVFLMLAIAVAIGAAILRLSRSEWKPAVPPGAAVCACGLLASALILFRIVFPPGFGEFGGVTVDATLEAGVFLGLLAALGIAYGGWRAMAEEGTSFARDGEEAGVARAAREAESAPGEEARRETLPRAKS